MTDSVTDDGGPLFNLAVLLESIFGELYAAAAQAGAPALVHPVLGRVQTAIEGLWPTGSAGVGPTPTRLMEPAALRRFLVGANARSQTLGKLSVLGLPVDALQDTWSVDGAGIGDC